eukprot:Protomagalhaensia_sp_Gyna_25__1056@NODE_150_length_4865_cov_47_746788_g116_i0_p2_GENE_NODE_150_length_4865_cov_47_746788_g116_i0NODE_150_length_4865_cov_47_746788_g116_i0_p2_ORF_typecomplete_len326_score69_52Ank_4/PF13637_6/2_7e05Ank_4/PF13637_6/5_7e12Ank_2/PF12796_7/0_00053Ank_2/PF12796_7/4e13Ank_5/PF13857_6/0_00027Ank_5/PF13857_6/1_5e09Ank_5/PF13857_6/3_6Ank_3/PF13606_6/6_7e05Ank_3/PF13606_6/8_3e05Ank_3/PF13606_6/1_9e02Ank/PF00023_30/0_00058Ank/PF00023_30/0_0029Ank/PF00023_30/2_7_NODE_150_leng
MRLQLEAFFVLFEMSITTQSNDLERLHAKCRDPASPISDLLNLIEAQYPRLLANQQKAANKKKRKAQNAFEQDQLIEAPWLRKVSKTDSNDTPSAEHRNTSPVIGPAIPTPQDTEPRPFDLFVIDGDESGTTGLRTKLRNWVSQKDTLGRTALHLAAFNGNIDAMKLLTIKDGKGVPLMDIHISAQDGAQPLHFAASAGNLEAVKLCLRLGSRVNAATSKAKTALDFAQKKGHQDVVDFLLAKHARSSRTSEKTPEARTEDNDTHSKDEDANETAGQEDATKEESAVPHGTVHDGSGELCASAQDGSVQGGRGPDVSVMEPKESG